MAIDCENPRIGPYFGTPTDFILWDYLPSQCGKHVHSHKERSLGWLFVSRVTSTFLGSDPVLKGRWIRPWISLGWPWTAAAYVWLDKTFRARQWVSSVVTLLTSASMAAHAVCFHVPQPLWVKPTPACSWASGGVLIYDFHPPVCPWWRG